MKINKLFTLLIVMLPFLYQYKSPVGAISLGEFVLIPFIGYYLLNKHNHKLVFNRYNGYYSYIFVAVLLTLFCIPQAHFDINDFLTTFIRIIYYCILIYVSYGKLDVKYAMKSAFVLAVFFSAYAIVQFTVHKLTGTILPTVLNPDWVNSAEAGIRLDYKNYYRWTYRSSSLFLEPSYFAGFSAVGLSAGLFFFNNERKSFYMCLLITAGLVASTSSAGLVILLINWGLYFYINYFNKKKGISTRTLIISMAFVLFAVFLLSSSMASVLLERTASGASFSHRIVRGIRIAENLNSYQWVFGVGINNLGNFVKFHNITTLYDEIGMENYASSLIGTLLCSGMITLIFYIRHYLKMWTNKNNNILSKSLVLNFTFLSIIEMNSFSYRSAFFLIMIFNIQYLESEIRKEGRHE